MTTTPDTRATAQKVRDRAAMGLMLLAALGALLAFVGSVGTAMTASPDAVVAESWRMYGFLIFAGLFVLLALRPRRYPGVWELVIFHKVAVSVTAATLVEGGAVGASSTAVADGVLAVATFTAYLLSRGHAGWVKLREGD